MLDLEARRADEEGRTGRVAEFGNDDEYVHDRLVLIGQSFRDMFGLGMKATIGQRPREAQEVLDLARRTEQRLEERLGYRIAGRRIRFQVICPECVATR